jgi:hypothetical protein
MTISDASKRFGTVAFDLGPEYLSNVYRKYFHESFECLYVDVSTNE